MLGLLAALTAETKVRCCTRGALNCLNARRKALLDFWDAMICFWGEVGEMGDGRGKG